MGEFTNITEIVAPASASQGSTVPITVKVTNIHDYQFALYVTAICNSVLFIESDAAWIYPGETLEVSGSFVMPNSAVVITAQSYVEDGELGLPEGWHFDDEATKSVTVGAGITDWLTPIMPLLMIGLLVGLVLPMTKGIFKGK